MEVNLPHSPCDSTSLSLVDQIECDLLQYIDRFPNKNFAIQVIAKESGLSQKTIKRLLLKRNRPTYQTIFKIYAVLFETSEYKQLMSLIPKVIQEALKTFSPGEKVCIESENRKFLDFIEQEPLLAELFILAATGTLDKNNVVFKYGQYGLNSLKKLEMSGYIVQVDNSSYKVSNSTPNFDSKCLKFLGEFFVKNYSKTKNMQIEGQNSLSFYAEGLNEEGLKEWLKIDTESFYKKQKIANNIKYKGSKPVFTFNATDTVD